MAYWTEEEDQILKTERYNGKSRVEIANILNRTVKQIQYRIAFLGIQQYGWTQEEDELLKKLRGENKTYREIGIVFNMKAKSIAARCYTLKLDRRYSIINPDQAKEIDQLLDFGVSQDEISKGLNLPISKINCRRIAREKSKFWTKEEEQILKEYILKKLPIDDISKELNRSKNAIRMKVYSLRLLPVRNWSDQDVNILKDLVKSNYSYTNIAKQMNRTFKSVYKKATRLKLRNKKIIIDFDQKEFRRESYFSKLTCAKNRAYKKRLPFDLDEDFIKFIWDKQNGECFYTKIPMRPNSGGDYGFSIDRIDSNKGYTKDNTVLSSWIVNRMKSNIPLDSFLGICRLIVENFNKNREVFEEFIKYSSK